MRISRTIAPVLAFWLSGAFCLLMCATVCARVEPSAGSTGDVRPCCARSAAIDAEKSRACDASGTIIRGVGGHRNCCFLSARTSVRAPLPDAAAPAPIVPVSRCFDVPPSEHDGIVVADFHAPPLSRSDTHTRICVFLI